MSITNESFEDGLSTLPAWPDDWTLTAAAFMWGFLDFGTPYGYSEGFESDWDSNEDALDAFELSDLSDLLFDSGGTSESVEDFEELWNNAALTEWPETGVSAVFDLAGESVEDFEEEWPNRHIEIDDRSITYDPVAYGLSDSDARDRINALKATYELHRVDTDKHSPADSSNALTSPDATDEASMVTLANEMWTDCWAHIVSDTYHRTGLPVALSKPNVSFSPATDYTSAKVLLLLLELSLVRHFSWADCSGPGYTEELFQLGTWNPATDPVGSIILALEFAAAEYDAFEEGWLDNENSISAFTPGVNLDDFDFTDDGGPLAYENFETKLDVSFPGASTTAGAEVELSPTLPSQVECTGSFTGTAYVETRNKGSATWVQKSTITSLPVTVELDSGYEAVRIYTETYTSGSPSAEIHFLED